MNTLEFRDGALHLIDQTELPLATTVLECRDYRQVAEAIRRLSVRGAPAIGLAAAYGAVLAAESLAASQTKDEDLIRGIEGAIDELAATRPTAVNLFWALDRMRAALHGQPLESSQRLIDTLKAEADAMLEEDRTANRQMGQFGAELIPDGANVLTHCNAGALATGAFGTAVGVIMAAHEAGKHVHVWVDETRPLLQGARLTAWELQQVGIPYTLITDNMAGHFMARGAIDLAVVGADRIVANGDAANKIGTYSAATLARAHDIPFYFAAPTSTVDLATPSGDRITIEERKPEEVTTFRGVRVAPEGATVANPAFDVTPARLITAIITERGVVRPPFADELARMVHESRSSPEPAIPVAALEREV